jgi:hypothetical protein
MKQERQIYISSLETTSCYEELSELQNKVVIQGFMILYESVQRHVTLSIKLVIMSRKEVLPLGPLGRTNCNHWTLASPLLQI